MIHMLIRLHFERKHRDLKMRRENTSRPYILDEMQFRISEFNKMRCIKNETQTSTKKVTKDASLYSRMISRLESVIDLLGECMTILET